MTDEKKDVAATKPTEATEATADENITTLDNPVPSEPADDTVTTLNNPMPSEPVNNAVTTMNNPMPAPPALKLDGK